MPGEFLDTNVLVYAFDSSAGAKRDTARALIERLLTARSGLLSTQVLAELLVTLTRKVAQPLALRAAIEIIEDLASWPVFTPAPADIVVAAQLGERWKLHFWDALILHAARSLGATVLWSEDLNAGQRYDGLAVQNPFR